MNARIAIASALIITAASAAGAHGASWLRIGDQADSYASAMASKTVSGAQVRGVKRVKVTTKGVARIQHRMYDVNYDLVDTWVETDAVPDISGYLSFSCSGDSFGFRSGSFRNGGRTFTMPVSNPTSCTLSLSVSGSVDVTYPDAVDWVLARATVEPVR